MDLQHNKGGAVRHASLLWIGYIFTALLLVQAAPITRLVFYPEEVSIIGDEVSLARSFPMDAMGLSRPFLSFSEVVRPLTPSHNNGQSCETVGGPFQYTRATGVGVWTIPWAAHCLDDPAGFEWSARWYWHIGALRVGPVKKNETFLVGKYSARKG